MSISGLPPKPPANDPKIWGDPHVEQRDPKTFGPDLADPKTEAPTKVTVNRQRTVKFGDQVQTFDKMVEVDITNMRAKADAEKPSF